MRGLITSARASATRCCWPPESSRGSRSARCGRRTSLKRILDLLAAFGRIQAAHLEPKADIVGRAHMRKQRVGLEHHAGRALVGRQPGHVLLVEQHAAARRRQEARDHAQGRGLAAAGGPEQRHQLAFAHHEIQFIHGHRSAEALGQLLDRKARHQTTRDSLTKRSVITISSPTRMICTVATAASVGSIRNSR